MRYVFFFFLPGILSFLLGMAAWLTGNTVLLETYKLVLSFTPIGVIGVAVKATIDAKLEDEKEKNRRYHEWERSREGIIKEFTYIFSRFYSIRKLYHSALSHEAIYDQSSPEYLDLVRLCLQKATELEGRYGALKTLIIHHFKLSIGYLGKQEIDVLIAKRREATTEKERLRYTLDILGEAYDDWRHALEQDRRIDVTESWNAYEEILEFLDRQTWQGSK